MYSQKGSGVIILCLLYDLDLFLGDFFFKIDFNIVYIFGVEYQLNY